MSIKITIPNTSSDVLTFGSANTPTAAQIAGIDSGSSNGQLALYTTASGTSTERIRVDASGNVGIGTASPSSQLSIGSSGTTGATKAPTFTLASYSTTAQYRWVFNHAGSGLLGIGSDGAGAMIFGTGSSYDGTVSAERMRIDSSGNLLVAQTTQNSAEKFGVSQSSASGQAGYFYASDASYNGSVVVLNTARAANTAFSLLTAYSAGVIQFYVGGSGFIYSIQLAGGATTLSVDASGRIIRTPSDASLKTNIQPITYGLDTVMKLKPIKHEWVKSINMGAPSIGFIAQDMELEVPEVVSGEEYKSIDYPKLTAVLTKAIQEMKAIIDAQASTITQLQADVAALKGTK